MERDLCLRIPKRKKIRLTLEFDYVTYNIFRNHIKPATPQTRLQELMILHLTKGVQ
jgi:hypothetical protein